MNAKKMGMVLATAVAGLALAGQVVASGDHAASPGKVKCSGINSCKGSSACKTADNECKGHNSCKGKGWIEVDDAKTCTDKGGKVEH